MMEWLEGLTDPRQEKKVLHNFIETIMLVICAVIAGCDVWEDIADYCRVKEAWFLEKLALKLEKSDSENQDSSEPEIIYVDIYATARTLGADELCDGWDADTQRLAEI